MAELINSGILKATLDLEPKTANRKRTENQNKGRREKYLCLDENIKRKQREEAYKRMKVIRDKQKLPVQILDNY